MLLYKLLAPIEKLKIDIVRIKHLKDGRRKRWWEETGADFHLATTEFNVARHHQIDHSCPSRSGKRTVRCQFVALPYLVAGANAGGGPWYFIRVISAGIRVSEQWRARNQTPLCNARAELFGQIGHGTRHARRGSASTIGSESVRKALWETFILRVHLGKS